MTNALAMRIGALMGLMAVALGAFGAHGLKDVLARNETVGIWEKAVFYHFVHVIMLIVEGTLVQLPGRDRDFLRFTLPFGIYQRSLVGRHHTLWRRQFYCWLALAGIFGGKRRSLSETPPGFPAFQGAIPEIRERHEMAAGSDASELRELE